ncbi:2-hydroxychromene-2-carboxylate isomerase [Qipengyuania sp.]|uniref:2-hydroxychromene-2-carboxylate isomerase n=1 Tax=Qipengyuania sp. TaxID=2004515 RepID=UPI003AF9C689
MSIRTVEYIFDFAAPNGYLAWYPLKDIVARTGAQLTVTPVFLGGMHKLTGNAPPMIRDADVRGKVPYAALEFQRFLDRHGMDRFRMHPALPFNSIMLQRVLVAAQDEAERQAIVEALLPAVWERTIDCADGDAVGRELAQAGLDAGRLLAATQDPEVKAQLAANTEHAVDRGAFGIPTFFVDGEMWFGKERLGQLADYLAGGKP